ncbi:TPA: hypothetical protein EYP66_04655 [Candidatus Poribacteria bacterium]|nr:hypothetical protein [Candidatus Poribacteria bacterium]
MNSNEYCISLAIEPVFEKPVGAKFDFQSFIGQRADANLENWLLKAPIANPAMLQMFRDQERQPHRDLLPWSGEFVGKYLISAILGWRISRDERLKNVIDVVIGELIDSQLPDGYLGPFPTELRLTSDRWDVWGHYHWMQALLMYYQDTAFQPALDACCKAGDLIHRTFVGTGESMKSPEQNLAILHGACLLYEKTGQPQYLKLAEWVISELDKPGQPGYISDALARKEIQEFRARRWEGLHCIQGICELGFITGDPKYHDAFTHIWWAMLKGDRHNTGGFTSAEACQGNPYDQRAIETCCTVAWVALTIDMLRLTGDSRVADELELSLFNGILGAQHPSGRWWTYNTPMDGERRASAHDIVFQARPGSPELNCCSVNAPRGLGMLSEWTMMLAKDGVVLNYYGPGAITLALPSGTPLTISQETEYPLSGKVKMIVELDKPENFTLYLRIPGWSKENHLCMNGEEVGTLLPGSYFSLNREWKRDDVLALTLDLSPHFWVGEKELEGKTSIYHGPILLTYDRYFNSMDPDNLPALDARSFSGEPMSWDGWLQPWLLFRSQTKDGRELRLCDFASAGASGTLYRSWLPVEGLSPVSFSRENPKRISRPS